MAGEIELRQAREAKLAHLTDRGITAYPSTSTRTHDVASVLSSFETLNSTQELVTIAGRVRSIRGQGKIFFVDIDDGSARMQVVLRADNTIRYLGTDAEDGLSLFAMVVDIGDFIDVQGVPMVTKAGQNSIDALGWRMLTKSMLPIPDSFYGLKDEDERYRKRYLDILLNEDQKDMFLKKAKFWSVMRSFLERNGFIEVHTPTLEVTTGGAEADPFSTHHNDYDMDVYLRISVGELWQKRLMAAGFPKTYEIGRVYRNEGTSPNHLQEFTNVEFYWAYADYQQGMRMVQELYRELAREVFGTTAFSARGYAFDLGDEWKVLEYATEIKEQTGVDIWNTSPDAIRAVLAKLDVATDAKTFERLVDSLWKHCRKQIAGPAFVIGYPDFMQPLAKRSEQNPRIVEQFQVLIGGSEIGKGYSELNDPHDQRQRFAHQQSLRAAGDNEAMMEDTEFVDMLEHGMPPTFGFGAGERLFAFLVDKPIRETQLFPLMRPKQEE
ncbi:MAG: lysyl-tRNA synthetase [Candidatus Parcubacteria bacterium]|jgi:lysyl-tRNA synthetase class 2